ncbi:unnamed protein product [Rotaria sp. Silwood2]|nr:unnamed protein product [Rotaria sp. Silwood2]CAF4222520.1 unnamed protein product [Rotaria sp. Silwood2]
MAAPVPQQMSMPISTPLTTSIFSDQSSTMNTNRYAGPMFSGFGTQIPSQASVGATIATNTIEPPPSSLFAFSTPVYGAIGSDSSNTFGFGGFGVSATSSPFGSGSAAPSASFGFSLRDETNNIKSNQPPTFGSSTLFSAVPPTLPSQALPPPPSFGFPFGITTTTDSNNSAAFSASAMFYTAPSTLPPPPPPPPSYPNIWGTSVNNNNNTNVPFESRDFGSSSISFAPPPPPTSTYQTALFGNSNTDGNIASSVMHPGFCMQQHFKSSSVLPTPPPTTGALPLSNTYSQPQSSFSFGSAGGSTFGNVAPQTIVYQSMSTIPPASTGSSASFLFGHVNETSLSQMPPSFSMMSTTTTSTHTTAPPSSTGILSYADNIQDDSYESHRNFLLESSIDYDKDREQQSSTLNQLCDFGVFETQETESNESGKNDLRRRSYRCPAEKAPASSISSVRYTDTRSDEIVMKTMASTDRQALDNSSTMNKRKKRIMFLAKETSSFISSEKDLLLIDVTPLSLGIEDINGHMCIIISRNQTIPLRTLFYPVFTNAYAYQTTTAIRVFRGEHKLTKYNTFIGEFMLTGLTQNFASETLEISISMDIDGNGLLRVEAEESRSGAKTQFTIDLRNYPLNKDDIERHISYVESSPDFCALCIRDRKPNDALYMLKGETSNSKINFTCESEIFKGFPTFNKLKQLDFTTTTINELKRIQLTNGSFDLHQDLANLLFINIKDFDELKLYLNKQGFKSFALNIQNDIIHLIATGIILLELLLQVPGSERNVFLVPFDSKQIQSILHRHLPRVLLENIDKAIHFYEQKRSCYEIYCEQLELNYSSWEKFIQYTIFHINN